MGLYVIVGGLVAVLGFLIWYGSTQRKAGSDAISADVAKETADVLRKQGEAIVNAPSNKAEVIDRLRNGGGL